MLKIFICRFYKGIPYEKRVLHILSSTTLFGAENMATEICLMSDNAYDMTYASPTGNIQNILSKRGVSHVSIQKFNIVGIRKVIKKIKPDIIHTHDNKASLLSFIACKKIYKKPKLVSHIHNSYPYLKSNSYLKVVDYIFRRFYDANIFCSENVRLYYENSTKYYKSLKNISVLNNFVNPTRILASAETPIEIDNNLLNIGFIGRLEEQKGLFEFFIELQEKKDDFNKNVQIYIIGKGSLKNKLKRFVDSKLSNMKITFIEFQVNPYSWIKEFDLMILPSKYEGLPLTVLEAMVLKVPVLAMNVGSLNEVIHNDMDGWLIESGNYSAFINKLINLCEDKAFLKIVGERAYRRIIKHYSIDEYKNNLFKLYKDILLEV